MDTYGIFGALHHHIDQIDLYIYILCIEKWNLGKARMLHDALGFSGI